MESYNIDNYITFDILSIKDNKILKNNDDIIYFKTPSTYSPFLLQNKNNSLCFNISLDKKDNYDYISGFIDNLETLEKFIKFNKKNGKTFLSSIYNSDNYPPVLKLKVVDSTKCYDINKCLISFDKITKKNKLVVVFYLDSLWENKKFYGINYIIDSINIIV